MVVLILLLDSRKLEPTQTSLALSARSQVISRMNVPISRKTRPKKKDFRGKKKGLMATWDDSKFLKDNSEEEKSMWCWWLAQKLILRGFNQNMNLSQIPKRYLLNSLALNLNLVYQKL